MKPLKKERLVALDLDDTVVDFLGVLVMYFNHLHGTFVAKENIDRWDVSSLEFRDMVGNHISGSKMFELFKELEVGGIYAMLPALHGAQKAIQVLQKRGVTVAAITARKDTFSLQTKLCLCNLNIPIDHNMLFLKPSQIEMDSRDFKVSVLKDLEKKYEIVAFADDSQSNVTAVNNYHDGLKFKSYLIDAPHNRTWAAPVPTIVRVRNLMEMVGQLIKEEKI